MLQTQPTHAHSVEHDPTSMMAPQPDATDDYEPPAIVYRAPLEVTAAFCDPVAGGKTPVESCFAVINS
jgi:hypothetical protein